MADQFYPMEFTKQAQLTGAEKAAILFAELGVKGTGELLKYFSTQELNKLRKGLKKLGNYNIRQLGRETSVLEETAKYAHAKRLWAFPPELLSNAKYSQYHEKDGARNFLKGLSKNPDAVASVLSVWLKEE